CIFFFQAEDGIRVLIVTGVQTCALPIYIGGLSVTPTASDFDFKVGNDSNPGGWGAATVPTSITMRPGAGVNGSARVTILWANNEIGRASCRERGSNTECGHQCATKTTGR